MYIQGHYEGEDGTKLFYRGWLPETPRALMILIHGGGEHSGCYMHIGERCLQQRIAMFAPDLRGFGQSEGLRGHVNHFHEYLSDLNILLRHIRSQYPSIPLFLLGHSIGGLITIRYGQEYPHEVNGVVLSSPALGVSFQIPALLKQSLHLLHRLSPKLSIDPFRWTLLFDKIRVLKPFLPNSSAWQDPFFTKTYTPRWVVELLQNGMNALAEAPRFRLPLLCVYDQKDPIVNAENIQRFLDSVSVEDKKFVAFSDGLHKHWEHDCDTFLDHLLSWLAPRCHGC